MHTYITCFDIHGLYGCCIPGTRIKSPSVDWLPAFWFSMLQWKNVYADAVGSFHVISVCVRTVTFSFHSPKHILG